MTTATKERAAKAVTAVRATKTPRPANASSSPKVDAPGEVKNSRSAIESPNSKVRAPSGTYIAFDGRLLKIAAEQLDDLERTRIANENRLRQLTRSEEDSDGERRGLGYSEDDPAIAGFVATVDGLKALEHQAELQLKQALRKHPLGKYVKRINGLGEKQAARLLAAIGDPYIRPEMVYDDHTEASRPRMVSELWSYCGYGVVDGEAPQRRKGSTVNWSPDARMRCYLIAESCVKNMASAYRKVYDDGRKKYEYAEHSKECKRCGPSGKPAEPGSLLSNGHQHARSMRLISKQLLLDLWLESKRLHEAN